MQQALSNVADPVPGGCPQFVTLSPVWTLPSVGSNERRRSRHEIDRELRRLFPRHTEITWTKQEVPTGDDKTPAFVQKADYRDTIREYLGRELDVTRDENKDDILSLAEQFLAQETAS